AQVCCGLSGSSPRTSVARRRPRGKAKRMSNGPCVSEVGTTTDRAGVDRTAAVVPSAGVHAQVAALLHESRHQAPDHLGAFLARSVARFGMDAVSIYVSDFEQRRLVPILGSAATTSIDMDDSTGGRSFTTASQVEEGVDGGTRIWSVVVDGAARLGVMAVTLVVVDDEARALANSLAGVVAALLVTRGQCTDAYTAIRRTEKLAWPPRCSGTCCHRSAWTAGECRSPA